MNDVSAAKAESTPATTVESVVVRFAGDSGDGMQVVGARFTEATALMGSDLATFPDFPAEIRAPIGTTYGVSGYQIQFGSEAVRTPGDAPDVLVAMNPAGLKVNVEDLLPNGLIVANAGAFSGANLKKAGYETNPLTDGSLAAYRLIEVDISKLTLEAVKAAGVSAKDGLRCKNFWALGLVYWLFGRDRQPTIQWLERKFQKRPEVAIANSLALNAGHIYGETAELPVGVTRITVERAALEPGTYRNITGNEATAWGMVAGAKAAGLELFLGSYPITPASTLLHTLAGLKNFGVTTFQAEDEIAAVCAAIGASFAGKVGATSTSGPGVALKSEAIGLAVATELPLVIVDVQRAGPSTGLPTKTEQSDLLQAVYGRNGDTPLCVLAAATPGDCFYVGMDAVRIATRYMTPVMVLTDGYLANGAEPWLIPSVEDLPKFPVKHHGETQGFHPFLRDETTLARVWALPGTKGLEHRIGGIERAHDTGNISYDAKNHHEMTKVRAEKIARIADDLPHQEISLGDPSGDLVVVGWGSTFGAIQQAVGNLRRQGKRVSHVHVRHLWPLPHGLEELLEGFEQIMVPEMNNGMLVKILRSEYLLPAEGFNKISGQPFKVRELESEIAARLERGALPPKARRSSSVRDELPRHGATGASDGGQKRSQAR